MTSVVYFLILTISALISEAGTRFDFDGDNRADLGVFRPQNGTWYLNRSGSAGYSILQFGQDGDQPMADDYDGDGKADPAVFRGGNWYRLKSATNTWDVIQFGLATDTPVPADFDGDGKIDVAVFRESTGQWHLLLSSNNSYSISTFGKTGDIPVPSDFDGDHRADLSVFRPSDGTWHRLNSGSADSYTVKRFGLNGDIPVTGDFDGDSKTDIAVWRPSDSNWYIDGSAGSLSIVRFGLSTDSPVPADYDGDGKTDISVYRPSSGDWYRINSATGTVYVEHLGLDTDVPAPLARGGRGRGVDPLPTPSPTPTVTPTPTPTATPTPTVTPTPTPTPAPAFTCDYYAAPNGTTSASGTLAAPWDLQTALGKTTLITNGKTLCLRGGTYVGKYRSSLSNAVVRSSPGEWAKIDGYKTTTLPSSITATQTAFSLGSSSGVLDGGSDEIVIGGEVIKVFGKSGNNITGSIRGASSSLNGGEPHVAGSTVIIGGDVFYISGLSTTYRDFEVFNSRPSRDGNIENQTIGRGNGITVVSSGNKLVNLAVHDNLSGVFTSSASSNTEIYGCVVYNNGMHVRTSTVEDGKGHGLYLENNAGYSRVYEDIVFNNFNLGMQGYGVTGPYVGGELDGTVISNSGSPLGKFGDLNRRNYNLILGPDSQPSPTGALKNSHFFHSMSTSGYSVKFGYGAGVTTGTITGNYFVGGGTLFEVANTMNATISNNNFYSSKTGAVYAIAPNGRPYTWNNNTYHGGANRDVFGIAATGLYQFTAWRTMTSFDLASVTTPGVMPTTVIVRPNAYEAGRANVIIYGVSNPPSVSVNLSQTGLTNGQRYTIRNAQDYFGAAIATGTYSSSSPNVLVPLTGTALSVAAPIGFGFTPATSCPQLCTMVVLPN